MVEAQLFDWALQVCDRCSTFEGMTPVSSFDTIACCENKSRIEGDIVRATSLRWGMVCGQSPQLCFYLVLWYRASYGHVHGCLTQLRHEYLCDTGGLAVKSVFNEICQVRCSTYLRNTNARVRYHAFTWSALPSCAVTMEFGTLRLSLAWTHRIAADLVPAV